MINHDQESKEGADASSGKHSRDTSSLDEKAVHSVEVTSEQQPKHRRNKDGLAVEYEVESQEGKEDRPSFYQRHRKWMQ